RTRGESPDAPFTVEPQCKVAPAIHAYHSSLGVILCRLLGIFVYRAPSAGWFGMPMDGYARNRLCGRGAASPEGGLYKGKGRSVVQTSNFPQWPTVFAGEEIDNLSRCYRHLAWKARGQGLPSPSVLCFHLGQLHHCNQPPRFGSRSV